MNVLMTVWSAFAVGMVVVWLRRHRELTKARRKAIHLGPDTYDGPPPDAPRVSVMIAARDEQRGIETCVRSLLAQDYPNFEIIVADDRSRDRTAEILDRLAAEFPNRLRVLHITETRPGFNGKPNAMHEAAQVATGEFLLCSDADCEQRSNRTLSIAVRYALEHDIEFLSVIPLVEPSCRTEAVVQPVCVAVLMFWHPPAAVNNPAKPQAYANGAFMLFRRQAYDKIGGHQAVRDALLEDIKMAQHAKAMGVRLRVAQNQGLYHTRMYDTPRRVWRGWSRIMLGSLQKPAKILVALFIAAVFSVLPWVAAAVMTVGALKSHRADGFPLWIAAACWYAVVIAQMSVVIRFYRVAGIPVSRALTYPIGAVAALGILTDTLLRSLGLRTTSWRGTTYRKNKPTNEPSNAATAPATTTPPPTATTASAPGAEQTANARI